MSETNYAELWREQSKLLWSRLQTALILNSAILAGWWKVRSDIYYGNLILVFGIVVSVLLGLIFLRDREVLNNFAMTARELKHVVDYGKPRFHGSNYGAILIFVPFVIYSILLLPFITQCLLCILENLQCSR